jgi:hypothetical protein
MNIVKLSKQFLTVIFCVSLAGFSVQAESRGQQPTPPAPPSTQDLRQLVAPIALYPDALVAQVLAASTYPTEIVEADRWMQSHSGLTGQALAQQVDQQPWDPSVKALTQFPSVLENMDKNLTWTSSLGDAYANQQQDVMDTVQALRQQARDAGNLKTNDQENVKARSKTITIEPANPEVVYVPAYDPWLVYGDPIAAYPFWFDEPGIFFDGPGIFFGAGFGIGFFGGFGWGWNYWGFDWHRHHLLYNHNAYVSHSRTIINRNGSGRSNAFNNRGPAKTNPTLRGSSATRPQMGTRSGAFSGFDHGGNVRGFSMRGQSSFGGGFHGGGFHGGSGGFHGGGGRH